MARPKEKIKSNYKRGEIDEESRNTKQSHKITSALAQKDTTKVLAKRVHVTNNTKEEIGDESINKKPPRNVKSAPPQKDSTEESFGTILIMNAGSPSGETGKDPKTRIKQTIHDVIEKCSPGIVLFQEFTWKKTSGKTWGVHELPDKFILSGHEHAALLFDKERYDFENIQGTTIETLTNNTQIKLQGKVAIDQNEFSPKGRMEIKQFQKKDSNRKIIIISWHGRSNNTIGGSLQTDKKRKLFEYLFEFLSQLKKRIELPIIIGGDFNIAIGEIKSLVIEPFKIIECAASARRGKVIDYIIATTDLSLSDVKFIDLKTVSKATDPNQVLDHDPIFARIDSQVGSL